MTGASGGHFERRTKLMARSFPLLIHSLVELHDRGCLLEMAQRSRIPYTTLWRWERGLARNYDYFLVQRLCERYELRSANVWKVIHADTVAGVAGKEVAL